ncbi:FCD domain-containing protein [Conexibacter sp. JD483]|uniref:FadR/GntR family transcriptional regulator n=1 Tax=unclassified Conexibacter TaxID=2627773 RepID=UPI002726B31F|nr:MULTISPECIES: FCD domain-containing protein [unclassified Conexibacter]MDO8184338.1 FCD domain-containing protein [Conexibacter sp. CPCC 205706]MDO8197644.1 FCD domain-containing protein [Conexibacter sp. CPCC 205762]MDR9368307.1 FCD domain-containing protein [Conexibacter sp. JD483]
MEGELDLVERFGVSRGVVREGIRALEERGLISVKHGKGAVVTEPALWSALDEDVLDVMIASGASDRLAEVLECQRMFEVQAAGLAATRATSADLAQLEEAILQMSATADRVASNRGSAARYQEARLAFHRSVVRAAGNATLARLSEPLHRVLAAVGRREQPPARRVAAEIEEYRSINATIAARDAAQASEAMERHLAAVAADLLAN